MKKIVMVSISLIGLGFGLAFEWSTPEFEVSQPQIQYRFQVPPSTKTNVELKFYESRVKGQGAGPTDYNQLARIYVSLAKTRDDDSLFEKAKELAETSLKKRNFSNDSAHLIIADVLQAGHLFEDALKALEKVQHESPRVLATKANIYLHQGDIEQAHRHSQRLVKALPTSGTYLIRGQALEAMGEDEKAMDDYLAAIRLEDYGQVKESSFTRAVLARFLLKKGKLETARFSLNESLRINPEYPMALNLLAEIAENEGKYDEAASYLKRAYQKRPTEIFAIHLARVLTKKGDRKKADAYRSEAESKLRDDLKEGTYGHRLDLVHLLLDRGSRDDIVESLSLLKEELKIRDSEKVRKLFKRAQSQSKKLGVTEVMGLKEETQLQYSQRNA